LGYPSQAPRMPFFASLAAKAIDIAVAALIFSVLT
jgi:hypothetical protein